MADEKKVVNVNEQEEKAEEINLDELDEVTGGSIGNVQYTKTKKISSNTKSKM